MLAAVEVGDVTRHTFCCSYNRHGPNQLEQDVGNNYTAHHLWALVGVVEKVVRGSGGMLRGISAVEIEIVGVLSVLLLLGCRSRPQRQFAKSFSV